MCGNCAEENVKEEDPIKVVELVTLDLVKDTSEVTWFKHGYYDEEGKSNLIGENIIHIVYPSQLCSPQAECNWCTELVRRLMSRTTPHNILEAYIK